MTSLSHPAPALQPCLSSKCSNPPQSICSHKRNDSYRAWRHVSTECSWRGGGMTLLTLSSALRLWRNPPRSLLAFNVSSTDQWLSRDAQRMQAATRMLVKTRARKRPHMPQQPQVARSGFRIRKATSAALVTLGSLPVTPRTVRMR